MPTAGAGAAWWQIDVLGFDEAFFGTQYLKDIFVVEQGQYGELGMLMMTAAFLSLILPVSRYYCSTPRITQPGSV